MSTDPGEKLFQAVLGGDERTARRLLAAGAPIETTCPCGCGQGLLVAAILAGSRPLLRTLLEHGADPCAAAGNGETPLMQAATWNDPEMIDILVAAGADLGSTAATGRTALAEAIFHGKTANVAHLVKAGADVDTGGGAGIDRTALTLAAMKGDRELVSLLLERGANAEIPTSGGRRPLMAAAAAGHLEIVELLLAHGAKPDARDVKGSTALLHATAHPDGQPEIVRRLVQAGGDPNRSDERGTTPLHEVARCGNRALLGWLLDHGADPHARSAGGRTALHQAAAFGRESSVDLLAARLPELVDEPDRHGRTALAFAAERGSLPLVECLAGHGASVDPADGRGSTPLFLALEAAHLETADALIRLGADVNHRSRKGNDALAAAARASDGSKALSWLFAQDGFEPPAKRRVDEVLLEAAERGAGEAVSFLLDAGGDPDVADANQRTALGLAVRHGSYDDRYRRPRSAKEDPVAGSMLALLLAGAEPVAVRGEKEILCDAIQLRCPEVCRALVKAGAAVDPEPVEWMTPLAGAVARGEVVLARMLLARGASPSRRGRSSTSAIELARESDKPAMRRLFDLE